MKKILIAALVACFVLGSCEVIDTGDSDVAAAISDVIVK